ncbi:MAG TPA: TIGR01212 family radical SAM protein [Clostridiales bacterium]|jgi:radical SAM protein (TIGR01212 family)|nr:TIGR01212 family radical SAM protein [Clostridiales bacterium]
MPNYNPCFWNQKRYHSLDYELKRLFGHKVYKLSLNGGMSCPNRDGTLDTRGCIFCSSGGSGDFASSPDSSITDQIEAAKQLVKLKLPRNEEVKYIAYFQAYTNTHASIDYLRKIFMEAINHPDILILSIATRPDCLSKEVLELLDDLNKIKPLWIELGLQTIHERTAQFIRRGYSLATFDEAVKNLHQRKITIIVHTILGLPGESKKDILESISYLGKQKVQGIKLQLLHILKGTDLGVLYEEGKIDHVLDFEEYVDLVIACLEHLPKEMVIHRISGDGPKKLLLAPLWSGHKKMVLNRIHQRMKELDTWQGRLYDFT